MQGGSGDGSTEEARPDEVITLSHMSFLTRRGSVQGHVRSWCGSQVSAVVWLQGRGGWHRQQAYLFLKKLVPDLGSEVDVVQ